MIITISLSRHNLSLIQAVQVARANGENISELIRKLAEKGMDCTNHDNERLADKIAERVLDKLSLVSVQPQQQEKREEEKKVDMGGLLGD